MDRDFFESNGKAGEEFVLSAFENFAEGALAELDRDLVVIERGTADKLALVERDARGPRFGLCVARDR